MLYAAIFIPLLIAAVCTGGLLMPIVAVLLIAAWGELHEEKAREEFWERIHRDRGDW